MKKHEHSHIELINVFIAKNELKKMVNQNSIAAKIIAAVEKEECINFNLFDQNDFTEICDLYPGEIEWTIAEEKYVAIDIISVEGIKESDFAEIESAINKKINTYELYTATCSKCKEVEISEEEIYVNHESNNLIHYHRVCGYPQGIYSYEKIESADDAEKAIALAEKSGNSYNFELVKKIYNL